MSNFDNIQIKVGKTVLTGFYEDNGTVIIEPCIVCGNSFEVNPTINRTVFGEPICNKCIVEMPRLKSEQSNT